MKILLTGGAGYIGSHTYVALVQAGFTPVVLDNFSNSHPAVLQRLRAITGQVVLCEQGDVLDTRWVESVLRRHPRVAEVAVAATPDPVRGDEVLACVIAREPVPQAERLQHLPADMHLLLRLGGKRDADRVADPGPEQVAHEQGQHHHSDR